MDTNFEHEMKGRPPGSARCEW